MNILVSACLLGLCCRYDGKSKPCSEVIELKDKYNLIPFCPEIYGGLATPRNPAEICGNKVITSKGDDVTVQYQKGAAEAYRVAQMYNCNTAILKEKSPSCGSGKIYDGTFTRTLVNGDGVTAKYLKEKGIRVIGESEIGNLKADG